MVVDSELASPAALDFAPPPPSLACRKEELTAWVDTAKPGARIEYHRGHLVMDRVRGLGPFGERARRELIAVADTALALTEQGLICLVQHRHGCGDYSYVAVKAKPPSSGRCTA